MTAVTSLLPMLGLRIVAGPLELRGITDDVLGELCDLAEQGIHDPELMPFSFPWSDAPVGTLGPNTAQYHWRTRAEFRPEAWVLNLAVFHDGELVGCQGVTTRQFLVRRTGETGSWLGRAHHGRGIGTAMRRVMCAFLFDHLDFTEITSAAFADNPASHGVSRKVGYRTNGTERYERRGELAEMVNLLLLPEWLVRDEVELAVHGVEPFRRAIGLDS